METLLFGWVLLALLCASGAFVVSGLSSIRQKGLGRLRRIEGWLFFSAGLLFLAWTLFVGAYTAINLSAGVVSVEEVEAGIEVEGGEG